MKSGIFTFSALLLFTLQAWSQQQLSFPALGGAFLTEKTACLSSADRSRILHMLDENIAHLKSKGVLPESWGSASGSAKPTAGSFIWPLQQMPEAYGFNSYYGISNYVDLDPFYPNQILDYNCGTRSYDLSGGYNHSGIDIFLWPFPQQMQAQDMVAIIAAADGVIIGKEDGNFDKNCAMNNGSQWNAVYVGNTDGTISWYGHMKMNSLTEKAIGETVSAGEFLGIVGSSGSSTGPHLHFETHAGDGAIIEPFEGPCNNRPSLWASQKPYYEPTVNALLTHHSPPDFGTCPELESPNIKDTFSAGDRIYFVAYFHDQTDGNPASYTILRPDGSVFDTWSHTSNQSYYAASYWYWNGTVGSDWEDGVWQIKADYEGNTVTHDFVIGEPTAVANLDLLRAKAIPLYPNPNTGQFRLSGLNLSDLPAAFSIHDLAGRQVDGGVISDETATITLENALLGGFYLLQVKTRTGYKHTDKFLLRK